MLKVISLNIGKQDNGMFEGFTLFAKFGVQPNLTTLALNIVTDNPEIMKRNIHDYHATQR